ncbi:hypothetical protein CBR_g52588 [Chara braunii]|uniref:GIY-YIG domain-containing protein n=1 Tax=Chara braunii TaxID=69332 RepID=A0A388MAF6_CHABU|nr:hypothetical protein CBR_g52588 [Chara braunii]|eukprot:GBG91554.1 hypothetical protein CBR_g52588 [Chara braunii]
MYGPVRPGVGKEVAGSSLEADELVGLKRENEEYRRKLEKEGSGNESLIDRLLKENDELRKRSCLTRDNLEDSLGQLMKEVQELRDGRNNDKDLLVSLKSEIGLLRKEKQISMEETQLWRNEALRPGNKRGTISIGTPDVSIQTRQRVMESPNQDFSEELHQMKDKEYCVLREVEALKQKRAEAEARKLEVETRRSEAEVEVARLREQVERLTTEAAEAPMGGTDLKNRLEAAAASGRKTVRRGRPRMTPGKTPRAEKVATVENDRFLFLQEERKKLRALKKQGLEAICKQEGIKYKTVDSTADELAEMRADARFGKREGSTSNSVAEVEEGGLVDRAAGEEGTAKLTGYLKVIQEEGVDLVRCKGPVVYVWMSPWAKHMYVGATSRSLDIRWREHLFRVNNAQVVASGRRNQRLYRWLQRCGSQQYVALPLIRCLEGDLFDLEKFVILISAYLNSRDRPRRHRRRRAGKRERRRRARVVEDVSLSRGNTHLNFEASDGTASVSLLKLLNDCRGNGFSSMSVVCRGGHLLVNQWKLLKRCYGSSEVSSRFGVVQLRRVRGWLADGVQIHFVNIISFCSSLAVFKPLLAGLLSNPPSRKQLLSWEFERLVWLYSAVQAFSEKRTRYTLRCLLSGVIRRRFDCNVRSRLVVKIVFDECLNKAGIRKLCVAMLEKLEISVGWKWMLVRRMRVVWGRNRSVGDILYNVRAMSREKDVVCSCDEKEGMFPRQDGHVCFRTSEAGFVPGWLKNARNIPRPSAGCLRRSLKTQLLSAFDRLGIAGSGSRRELGGMMSGDLMKDCFNRVGDVNGGVCNTDKVDQWKERFERLVRCPIDHNPGDLLVCCPMIYRKGIDEMFVKNPGFEICLREEEEINKSNGLRFEGLGVGALGKWNREGKLGSCYTIPKHKDIRKWRPICPTYEECGNKASKRVARVVNQMLWDMPARSNFNMRSTEERVQRIAVANKDLRRSESFVSAAFDIKEMFCNLPHKAVMEAVRWIVDFWLARGGLGILLQERGKGAKVRMGDGQIGWTKIGFDEIIRFVEFDLSCTYVVACSVILQQRVGIPMGKALSPALACLLCAFAEFTFLNSLGTRRSITYGTRTVDDVSIFVRYKLGEDEGGRRR